MSTFKLSIFNEQRVCLLISLVIVYFAFWPGKPKTQPQFTQFSRKKLVFKDALVKRSHLAITFVVVLC